MIASWRLNCSHHPKFSWPFAFTYVLFYIMVVPWGGMAFNTKKLPGYVAVRRLIEADFFGYRNFCGSKSLTSESFADEPDHIGQSDPKPIETVGNDHEEVLNGK